VLGRFGEPLPPKDGKVVVALEEGAAGIAPIIRALDEADIAVQDLHLVQPSLDDVFLEKTGRHLEGADAEEQPAPEREPA
jgi:ABC-2 type transport system ATP-binding protein